MTIWVDVLLVIAAAIPLEKVTALLTKVGSKFVPVMVIVAPAEALIGVKLEIVGVGTTSKLVADVTLWAPLVVATVIGPVAAPCGTVVTIWVDVLLVTTAGTSSKKVTRLLIGVESKFVPVMVMVAPTKALAGVKLEIVGLVEDFPHPAMRKRRQTIILTYLSMHTPVEFKSVPPRRQRQDRPKKDRSG